MLIESSQSPPSQPWPNTRRRRNDGTALWYGVVAITLVLATVCAGLAVYTRFYGLRVEADYPPLGRMLRIDGTNLHYIRAGEGRPVVMIHGGAVVLQDFLFSIFGDVARSFDAIAFDRPGNGHSDRPAGDNLTIATGARIIGNALAALGVERPIIVGHSYGAAIALQLALDRPERVGGLVLLAPVVYTTSDDVPFPARLAETPFIGPMFGNLLLVPAGRGQLPGHIRESFAPQIPPQGYEDTIAAFGLLPRSFLAWSEERRHFAGDLRALSGRLSELHLPVAIVSGDADPVTPLKDHGERLHAAIPGSELTILPGAGHMVHFANPSAVIAAIRRAADNTAKP